MEKRLLKIIPLLSLLLFIFTSGIFAANAETAYSGHVEDIGWSATRS